MTRRDAVDGLIDRHLNMANKLRDLLQRELDTIKNLEAYKYELTKPGFDTKGWKRYGKGGRIETYVVQTGNTYQPAPTFNAGDEGKRATTLLRKHKR